MKIEPVRITTNESVIALSFSYLLALKIKESLKEIPGYKWDKNSKCWVWPRTSGTAADLVRVLKNFPFVQVQADADFQTLLTESAKLETHQAVKVSENLEPIPCLQTEAWLHQRRAYWYCEPMKAALLNMGMGTGKTLVAAALAKNRDHKRILIVCPKSVMDVWPTQIQRHTGEWAKVIQLRGSLKNRIDQVLNATGERIILVTNYESFSQAATDDLIAVLKVKQIDFIICDESHKLKSPKGAASKAIRELAKWLNCHRLCLSGTPLAHSPVDIWAQYDFLDDSIYGKSFFAFRKTYTIDDPFGGVGGYRNMTGLNERMYRICYQVGRDVLDLPELVESVRTYTLSSKMASEYIRLYDYFDTSLAEISIQNAITALLKCQQLCSGFLKQDDDETEVHKDKLSLLSEVIEEIDLAEPVVIFCRFQWEIKAIRAMLGNDALELSGRANDLAEWQGGAARFLVVQIQAGSVGIDLTRAAFCCYFSLDWSLANFEQSKARVHRPGQTRTTQLIYLLASMESGKPTIDADILAALQARRDFISEVVKERKDKEQC